MVLSWLTEVKGIRWVVQERRPSSLLLESPVANRLGFGLYTPPKERANVDNRIFRN